MTMQVQQVNSTFGARVTGVDLRQPLDDAGRAELAGLLWQHGALVLPGQQLDHAQMHDFVGIFAPPAPQPLRRFLGGDDALTVLDPKYVHAEQAAEPVDTVPTTLPFPEYQGWHSDSTFAPEINAVATLRAEVTPPVGGDTCFADMRSAYDRLSPTMQGWLEGCEAIHWIPTYFKQSFKWDLYGAGAVTRFDEQYRPWRHPVVVRHPMSGRRSLFVNPVYTTEIVGLSPEESRQLLTFLFAHSTLPEYIYRHHWTTDDVVIWDELSMMHKAPEDFAPHPRRMIRVTGGELIPQAADPAAPRRERYNRVVRLPVAKVD
jgi:taurine dioxygenase